MNCPSCGFENPDGMRFCGQCGAEFASGCPSCGAESPPGFRFCGQCGAVLTGPVAPGAMSPRATPPVQAPTSFAAGRYRVSRLLGEGAKKRVYLAHDTRLDRDVALALIKTEGLDEGGRVRVRREAQAMGRLGDHPRIVTVYDTGDENGQPYIVSEYMDGGDLETRLEVSDSHRLPVDRALEIGAQICDA